jgi:glutamate-1-semialdehyde 2,1-aminomutase
LEAKTKTFTQSIQAFADERDYPLQMVQVGSIFWMAFSRDRILRADQIDPKGMDLFKVLHHELLQRGIYLGPSGYEVGFISAAHTEADLEEAAVLIKDALEVVFA